MQVKKVTFNESALLYSGKAPLKKQVVSKKQAAPNFMGNKVGIIERFLNLFASREKAALAGANNELEMLQGCINGLDTMLIKTKASLAETKNYVHNITKPRVK